MSTYNINGSLTVGAIGKGSRSFVANGPMTIDGDWITTTSTVVEINGCELDMTAAVPGDAYRMGGYLVERTATGLRAKSI